MRREQICLLLSAFCPGAFRGRPDRASFGCDRLGDAVAAGRDLVQTYLWVACGGAVGSAARFWLTAVMAGLTGLRFPWGTLLINVVGSLVIGLVAGLTLQPDRLQWHPDARIFLMTGVCGGFTTFSAFSLQTLELMQVGEGVAACGYAVASVLLCVAATWAGFSLARG